MEEQMPGAASQLHRRQCLRRRLMQRCRWLPFPKQWALQALQCRLLSRTLCSKPLTAGQEEVARLRLEAEHGRAADGMHSESDMLRGQLESVQAQAAHVAELEQEVPPNCTC